MSSADKGTTPPQVTVKSGDLDVSTTPGVKALYRRIQSAAHNVCWHMAQSNELSRLYKNPCQQKVIANAVAKVNEPALSALFASKYGISAPVVLAATGTR